MTTVDRFKDTNPGLDSPAEDAFAITPSDVENLVRVPRAIYVGSSGAVKLKTKRGTTVTFSGLTAGSYIAIRCVKVYSTGTTASSLIGVD